MPGVDPPWEKPQDTQYCRQCEILATELAALKSLVREMGLLFGDYFAFSTNRTMFEKDVQEILSRPEVKAIMEGKDAATS